MKKANTAMLVSAIVIEIAALILIAKAIATDSSATQGVILLALGLVFLGIALTRKSKDVKSDAP